MFRRILIFLVIFIALITAGIFYVNHFFFPVKVKALATTKASEFLKRNVSIGAIQFSLTRGFVVKDLYIYPKKEIDLPFLYVHQASFGILYTPLIKEKKIIIPAIIIQSPQIHIARYKDESWNFSDLLNKKNPSKNKKGSYSFFLGKVVIRDAKIKYDDQTFYPELTQTFYKTNFKASLSVQKNIAFSLETFLEKKASFLKAVGQYALKNKKLTTTIEATDVPLKQYLSLLKTKNVYNSGTITNGKFDIDIQQNNIDLSGQVNIQDASLTLKNKTKLSGDIALPKLKFNLKDSIIKAEGDLSLSNGKIALANGNTFSGDLFAQKTSIDHKENLLTIKSTCSIQKTIFEGAPPQKISGDVATNNLTLTLNSENNDLSLTGDIKIQNAHITTSKIEEINGNIASQNTVLTLKNKQLTVKSFLSMNDAIVKFNETQKLDGNISATSFSLSKENQKLNINGDLVIDDAIFVLKPKEILTGTLHALNSHIILNNEGFSATSDLLLKKAEADLSNNKKFFGTIKAPGVTATNVDNKTTVSGSIEVEDGFIQLATTRTIKGTFSAQQAQAIIQDKTISFTTTFNIIDGNAQIDSDKSLSANPTVNLQLRYNPTINKKINYSGTMKLNKANLTGVSLFKELKELTGNINFTTDQINTDSLHFSSLGTQFSLSGKFKEFTNPWLNLHLKSNEIDIEALLNALPTLIKEKIPGSIKGQTSLDITYDGLLNSPKTASITLASQIKNAHISSNKLKSDISSINGKLNYASKKISWINLQGTYADRQILINGNLSDFKSPLIETDIKTDRINISTKGQLDDNTFTIQSLTGDFFKSKLNIKGTVKLEEENFPYLDLKGNVLLNLQNLSKSSPLVKEKLDPFKLRGNIALNNLSFRGNAKDWTKWILSFTAKSLLLSSKGYKINHLNFNYDQQKQKIKITNCLASIYNGKFKMNSTVDTSKTSFPYEIAVKLTDSDLSELSEHMSHKMKDLAGLLSTSLSLNGQLNDSTTAIGKGEISIKDGNILELNLIKGTLSLLTLVVPQIQKTSFTDGAATFSIKNNKILTDDLWLKSSLATLNSTGWIDFKQNINFIVNPDFNEVVLSQLTSLDIGPAAIINQTAGKIFTVKIDGTLKKPKFTKDFNVIQSTIQNATDIIKDGIEGIFEGLF